jgi:hypothetical protein
MWIRACTIQTIFNAILRKGKSVASLNSNVCEFPRFRFGDHIQRSKRDASPNSAGPLGLGPTRRHLSCGLGLRCGGLAVLSSGAHRYRTDQPPWGRSAPTYPRNPPYSGPIAQPLPIARPIAHPARKPKPISLDCLQQWEEAYDMCREALSKPNPSWQYTGGY